jgi:drug/metabolite transporter (DMT)-like permease
VTNAHGRFAAGGVAMALGAAVLFSLNGTASKLVLEAGMSPLRLVEIRCAGAAACLVAIVAARSPGSLRVPARELGFLAVYGVTGIAMVQFFYLVAISRLPVGIALLLEFTAPLLVALWVRFVRGEPVRRRVWAALVLCLTGLSLVTEVWTGLSLDGLGILAGMGAALALATYYLLGERGLVRRDSLSLAAWSFVFAGLLWSAVQPWWTFPVGLLADDVALPGPLAGAVAPVWLLVAFVVLAGTVAPFLLVLGAIGRIGPARSGLLGMSEPVGAGLVAWIVLGEVLSSTQVVGVAVVLVGIVLAETARRRRALAPPGRVDPTAVEPRVPRPKRTEVF